MGSFLLLIFIVCFCVFPLVRCIVFNLHNVGIYSVLDIIDYFKYHKWDNFNYYGIDDYFGPKAPVLTMR